MSAEQVKPGYKRTEVGVIPEDWETPEIQSVCKLVNGRGFKPFEWSSSGLPIIRIQNLNGSDEFNYYQGIYDKKLEIFPGQLLFAWSGSRGTSFGPHIWSGPLGLLNYHTWKIDLSESKIDKGFFFHSIKKLTEFIEARAHGASALVHTQKWEMEKFHFAAPTNKNEQQAIANALSDADALLAQLDQLIAKKRDLKQAAMQQLLTGQTRLPGFSGEWQAGTLADAILALEAGVSVNSTDEPPDSGIPSVLKTSALTGGVLLPEECKVIETRDLQRARTTLKSDTILISRMNTPILVGEVAYIDRNYEWLYLPDRVWMTVFKSGSKISARWLAYLLSSRNYRNQLREIATGTSGSMKNISKGALLGLSIQYPEPSEQTAITTVLSDMDAELAALEARRDKTRALKQGMMQELLTGRIRLV